MRRLYTAVVQARKPLHAISVQKVQREQKLKYDIIKSGYNMMHIYTQILYSHRVAIIVSMDLEMCRYVHLYLQII